MNYPVDRGYRPSCVVNLTLRFDEALQVAEEPGDLQNSIASGEYGQRPDAMNTSRVASSSVGQNTGDSYDQSAGYTRTAAPGRRVVQQDLNAQVRTTDVSVQRIDEAGNLVVGATVTEPMPGDKVSRSLSPLTFSGDKYTTLLSVVPLSGNFDLPHPRQAATFNLTFSYTQIPIDPRLLRACGVEIHIGCVDIDDYGRGQAGETNADGTLPSIIATRSGLVDPTTGRPATKDSTLLFYGTVDLWEAEHTTTGSTVTLTGRSLVGLLLDGKPPVNVLDTIDLERPIHRVIADLIATIPTDSRFAIDVVTDANEWPNGIIPTPGTIDGFNKVRLGSKDGKPKASAGASTDRVSYWDLITNLCYLVGALPYLQGAELRIRPARSIFEIQDRPGVGPFNEERYAEDGKLAYRRLVLGRNVDKFKISRKFSGVTVPVVIAYGFDDRAKGAARLVSAQWPPKDSPIAKAKKEDDVLRIPIPNVRDSDRLLQIARDVYEEIGRGEISCEFATSVLSSFGGSNSDPDMLRLRPLDPIEVTVDSATGPTPIVHELVMQATASFQEEVQVVQRHIGDVDAARAIVAARRGAIVGVLDSFRVVTVNFTVGDKGIGVAGTCQNYIVSRHGQTEAEARANAGLTSPTADTKTARASVPGKERARKLRALKRDYNKANATVQDALKKFDGNETIEEARERTRAFYRQDHSVSAVGKGYLDSLHLGGRK